METVDLDLLAQVCAAGGNSKKNCCMCLKAYMFVTVKPSESLEFVRPHFHNTHLVRFLSDFPYIRTSQKLRLYRPF